MHLLWRIILRNIRHVTGPVDKEVWQLACMLSDLLCGNTSDILSSSSTNSATSSWNEICSRSRCLLVSVPLWKWALLHWRQSKQISDCYSWSVLGLYRIRQYHQTSQFQQAHSSRPNGTIMVELRLSSQVDLIFPFCSHVSREVRPDCLVGLSGQSQHWLHARSQLALRSQWGRTLE